MRSQVLHLRVGRFPNKPPVDIELKNEFRSSGKTNDLIIRECLGIVLQLAKSR